MVDGGKVSIDAQIRRETSRSGIREGKLWLAANISISTMGFMEQMVLRDKIDQKEFIFNIDETNSLEDFLGWHYFADLGIEHRKKIAENYTGAEPYWSYFAIWNDFAIIALSLNTKFDSTARLIPHIAHELQNIDKTPFVSFEGYMRQESAITINATTQQLLDGKSAIFGSCELSFRKKDDLARQLSSKSNRSPDDQKSPQKKSMLQRIFGKNFLRNM